MPDRPRPIVLHGAQVVDGSGRPPIRRGVVVVEGTTIGFVGPVSDSGPDLPADALVDERTLARVVAVRVQRVVKAGVRAERQ